ncbi:hypothetical protein GE061_006407 [Apolygus lucorum]|uniref:Uncharacterized protein n=1 Tax=Apolygus lucorum TaxID=248454 RepID=A0A8S9WWE1_APOLU|nr:hypothetical protein GE061_006407 [Apolygus lucorum]
MEGLRGKAPTFEPTSQFLDRPDHRFYNRDEQMHFPKGIKEPLYIPPKPVTPIFRKLSKKKLKKNIRSPEHITARPPKTRSMRVKGNTKMVLNQEVLGSANMKKAKKSMSFRSYLLQQWYLLLKNFLRQTLALHPLLWNCA